MASITGAQQFQYLKSVFLVILNVPLTTVFTETVTYDVTSYNTSKKHWETYRNIKIRNVPPSTLNYFKPIRGF